VDTGGHRSAQLVSAALSLARHFSAASSPTRVIMHQPTVGGGALSDAAIRPSVRLSVCPMLDSSATVDLGLWLLQNTNSTAQVRAES